MRGELGKDTPKKGWNFMYFYDVTDIKIKHYKNKNSFTSPEGAKVKASKTVIVNC